MLAASGPRLTAVLCAAEVLTMVGFSAYSVLLAPLRNLWSLSNADAGAIGGMFFAGYTIAVPFLVSMTDRVGSRRVWLFGASLTIIGTGGFGLLANGLATVAVFQAVAGAGLAGTYMPGLRLLADHLPPRSQIPRGSSVHGKLRGWARRLPIWSRIGWRGALAGWRRFWCPRAPPSWALL